MNSLTKRTAKLFQTLTAIVMIAGLLFPPTTLVYAQDEVPPVPAAEQTAEPPAADPGVVELPALQTVEAPVEPAPTEAVTLPLEATVEVPAVLPTEAPVEAAPADGGEEEAAPAESLVEIVEVLSETNTVLVDENNVEIPLTSTEAAEVLETADPFFKSGSNYIGYTNIGGVCPSFVTECNKVANPVGAALGDSRLADNTTLYIEGNSSSDGGGKLYNESVTITKSISLQAGRSFSKTGSNINFSTAYATINSINLQADLGSISRVYANNVFVDGTVASGDTVRGNMLDDALTLTRENGTITLSAGTFKDDSNGFEIGRDDITLEGAGDSTIIDGKSSSGGFGIKVTGEDVTIRKLKVISSYDGIALYDDDTTISNVTLTGNHTGLYAHTSMDNGRINNSNIFGNSHWGIYSDSNDMLDATNNYWGSVFGPTSCYEDFWGDDVCGTTYGDKVFHNIDGFWNDKNVNTGSFKTEMVCPAGMHGADGVCVPNVVACPPGFFDQGADGDCDATVCPPGSFDGNSDGACETTTCPAGFYDGNSDGTCEKTTCPAGSYDGNSDGVCETTTCPAGSFDANSDGVCELTSCPAGSFDANADGVCETTTCAPGTFDGNSDGLCETTSCPPGSFDVDSDGVCETTTCAPGTYDANSDGVCEGTVCAAGSFDANSDGVCESTLCAAGSFDANADGACEATICAAGSFDADSDGECEATVCAAGSFDVDSDGECEATVCVAGSFDADSDGECEATVCAAGSFDADSDGECEATVCAAGSFDADSDGECEATVCAAGYFDVDSDGSCEMTACAPGSFDVDSDGECEATVCAAGSFDADADGECEATACKAGAFDVDSDGECEATVCSEGSFDADSDGECELTECAAGFFDANSDGECELTECAAGSFDVNSDGECEPTICAAGSFDADSDGECEHTVCTGGTFDSNSDGICETRDPGDGPDDPFGPFGPFGPAVAGAGGNGVIPVTGGMNQLSCTEANTLVLANGNSVTFSAPMCGFSAGLNDENKDVLPSPLPTGLAYASGMTLSVQKGTTSFDVLPEPVTNTLSFVVPADLKDKTFVILYWDAAAKGGLGDWVEIPAVILKNGVPQSSPLYEGDEREVVSGVQVTATLTGVTTLNFTGTFVLAVK